VAIRFHPSARRHSIEHERSRYVIEHCACPLFPPDTDGADRIVFLGPDPNGVPLEVVGIELDDGDILVIHAMKMRTAYFEDYARVMRCQHR
jgi:hypothetical protein